MNLQLNQAMTGSKVKTSLGEF